MYSYALRVLGFGLGFLAVLAAARNAASVGAPLAPLGLGGLPDACLAWMFAYSPLDIVRSFYQLP